MTLAIVGGGRIGQALAVGLNRYRPTTLGGRALLAKRDLAASLGEATTVLHAAGPAGEAACKEDPGLAFALHYTLTERLVTWALAQPGRQLVLLGTVAPDVGFYGPLKRAAQACALEHAPGAVLIIECGHVIGEGLPISDRNAGVIARFVQGALQGAQLQIAGGGEQMVRYTPVSSLIEVARTIVEPNGYPSAPVLSPVSGPLTITEVGRTCLNLARLLYNVDRGVMVHAPHRALHPDYEDPTGAVVAVPVLADVLVQWMRTVEAKVLLGVR